ncbi:Tachykinin-like peptides receptor 99D [Pseudolycoriella hygida]|uniref:Tachykinin-like peptides receptor 99D n=1 Tax=Pseudolycoriella hygida TaxID=35572 RepID=A0A9Q0RWZ0_9DIPT|nr:Tachykinin-like peptides receptor 99D [Pseudolycoriella hygida]
MENGYLAIDFEQIYEDFVHKDIFVRSQLIKQMKTIFLIYHVISTRLTKFYQNVNPTNNSGTYDPNEFVLPWWRQILWSILFGGMVIVSTVGNLIVIWIVLAHKRMRTPTNYFLVNLSIADAMVSTLNVTFSFTYMLNSHWPFGTLYCKISQFVAILSIGASVFTLMAIAIDRLYIFHRNTQHHAESNIKSLNLNDTKEVKLHVTDNNGHMIVKEIRGEDMACIMKCFPVTEKDCHPKEKLEKQITFSTTPRTTETYESTDSTASQMSTMEFRSATSFSKTEQAVSAGILKYHRHLRNRNGCSLLETTPKVSHSTKEENEKIKDPREYFENALTTLDITTNINRAPATESTVTKRPPITFETIFEVTTEIPHFSDDNILSIWVMGILLASPNFLYFTTWNVNLSNDEIRIWPDGPTNHSTYNVLFTLLTYFLPIGSMTFTYARVGLELWGSQSIGECTQRQLDNIKSKRRVVKMMMVVVLIFAVCWLPFHVYFIITSYYPKITKFEYIQEIYLAIYWLAMSNSMYNPIIYCWMNSRFGTHTNALINLSQSQFNR